MVVIRMQRMGRAHRPFYRIGVMDKRSPRNGRVIENLGWYVWGSGVDALAKVGAAPRCAAA